MTPLKNSILILNRSRKLNRERLSKVDKLTLPRLKGSRIFPTKAGLPARLYSPAGFKQAGQFHSPPVSRLKKALSALSLSLYVDSLAQRPRFNLSQGAFLKKERTPPVCELLLGSVNPLRSGVILSGLFSFPNFIADGTQKCKIQNIPPRPKTLGV